jgi:hypothetical protein
MRSLFAWGCFGSLVLGGCGLASGLDTLEVAGDGGTLDGQVQDSPVNPGKDAGVDADSSSPSDGAADVKPADTGIPKDVAADAPCTGTCPSGTSCSASFCSIPQGPACGSTGSFNGSGGSMDGTVCTTSSGPNVQTTCSAAINSPATFINFSSSGDPWLLTVSADSGPIQIEVMNASCSTGASCVALAAGAQTTITVGTNTVVAIVSVNGCSDWHATYVSK